MERSIVKYNNWDSSVIIDLEGAIEVAQIKYYIPT